MAKITQDELQNLLYLQFRSYSDFLRNLKSAIESVLGKQATTDKTNQHYLEEYIKKWYSRVIAERLIRNDRTAPLVMPSDKSQLLHGIEKILEQTREFDPAKNRALIAHSLQVYDTMVDILNQSDSNGTNSYDSNWAWINEILELAEENGLPPIQMFTYEDSQFAFDELIRRNYTREGYQRSLEKAFLRMLDQIYDMQNIITNILEPLMDQYDIPPVLREEFKKALIDELRSEIDEKSRRIKHAISQVCQNETDRIFGLK